MRTGTACVDVRGESRKPGGVDHVRAEPAGARRARTSLDVTVERRAPPRGDPRRPPERATPLCAPRFTVSARRGAEAAARSTAPPSNTTPPAVTGTAVLNETLTAVPGSWTGTPPITFVLACQRCNSGGGGCASIPGQTGQTHVVTADDIGSTLRVL